jgi:hypothetical protein
MPGGKLKKYTPAKAKQADRHTRKIVKKVLDKSLELKFHNYSSAGSSLGSDATGTIFELGIIAQGTTDSNRIGDKVSPKSVDMRLTLRTGSAGTSATARVIIFQLKDSYDAASGPPLFEDLLNSVYKSTVNAVNAPRNMDKLRNFNVIYDKVHSMTIDDELKFIDIKRKRLSPIQYQAASSYYGTNTLWMMAISDDVGGTTGRPVLTFVNQMTYTDA